MPRVLEDMKRIGKPAERYQVTVYLNPEEAEAVKAISLAKDISLSSVIVNLMNESLFSAKYQDAIKAYQTFKKSMTK